MVTLIRPEEIAEHSVATVLDRAVETRPDSLALIAVDGRLTYAGLDSSISRAANALRGFGVGPGDRVAFSLPNTVASAVSLFATARIGAVWVGINRHLAPPEQVHMLADSGAAILVGEQRTTEAASSARSLLPELKTVLGEPSAPDGDWELAVREASQEKPDTSVKPTDVAAIAYTSGTTGYPKGAVHIHRSLLLAGSVMANTLGYGPSTRFGLATSMMNLMGQMLSTLTMAQVGGRVILIDRMHAARVTEWIRAEEITDMPSVGALIHDLAASAERDPTAMRSLRDIICGAGDIPPNVLDRFQALTGVAPRMGYGQTEIPGTATLTPSGESHVIGSSGRALPHVEVSIRDESGRQVPAGSEGEICVRAATTGPWAELYRPLIEYWKQPLATEKVMRDGYLRIGDLGHLSPKGDLFVAGRASTIIVRGGANVYPAEVERVLLQQAGVAAAAVVGVPDDRLGQRVVALVEPSQGSIVDSEACKSQCRAELAGFKCPESVFVVDTLPRNTLAKIVRPAAVEMAIRLCRGTTPNRVERNDQEAWEPH